jgi:MFS family permease
MVASAITFGAIVGAFLGGYLTDRIGRYRVFMADMLCFVIAAIACALAPNEYVLAGARFVMGSGVGIDLPVAMAFLAEFSKLKGHGNKAARVAMCAPPGMRRSACRTCWCWAATRSCPNRTAACCGASSWASARCRR